MQRYLLEVNATKGQTGRVEEATLEESNLLGSRFDFPGLIRHAAIPKHGHSKNTKSASPKSNQLFFFIVFNILDTFSRPAFVFFIPTTNNWYIQPKNCLRQAENPKIISQTKPDTISLLQSYVNKFLELLFLFFEFCFNFFWQSCHTRGCWRWSFILFIKIDIRQPFW